MIEFNSEIIRIFVRYELDETYLHQRKLDFIKPNGNQMNEIIEDRSRYLLYRYSIIM